jgi:hypothetical protein
VSQFSIAPTLCALLGLPQPPLADAPPALDLIERTALEETRALDAYVRARADVARSLGEEDGVDPIERRRAAASVRRLAPEREREMLAVAADVNVLLLPRRLGHGFLALVVAALWLATLVHVASSRPADGAAGLVAAAFALGAFALAFDPVAGTLAVGPFEAGAITVVACALAVGATRGAALRGAAVAVGALAALPLLAAVGGALQAAFDAEGARSAAWRAVGAALALVAVAAALASPRAVVASLCRVVRRAPGVLPAAAGAALGILLSVRVFVDPLVDVRLVVAAAGLATAAWLVLGRAGRARPVGERALVAACAVLLFAGTRVADAVLVPEGPGTWVGAAAGLPWALVAVAATLGVAALLPVRRLRRADAVGAALAALALGSAFAFRGGLDGGALAGAVPFTARGTLALGVVAWLWAWRFGSPEGRWTVRVLATLAMARRLMVPVAEYAAFAVLAAGAAVAARWSAPSTRLGLARLAVGLLAVRTAAFHAMGKTESFSTFDVAAGFAGLRPAGPDATAAAAHARLLEGGAQVAFLHAMPWLVLLAAAARALGDAAPLRRVVADLAVGFAARGAALVFALWAWWRSAWWTQSAYPVYAIGGGDLVLLAVAALLAGAFVPSRRAAPRSEPRGTGEARASREALPALS